MRQTEDIAPLVGIAEAEFARLHDEALAALHRLERFWERLYGPSEGLTQALEDVGALWDTFHESEGA